MRTLVATLALIALPGLALAQNPPGSPQDTTTSPPAPNASSQMPQPSNSLPPVASTAHNIHPHHKRHRHIVHHKNPSHAQSHTVPTAQQ